MSLRSAKVINRLSPTDDPVAPGPPDTHRATIRIGQLITEFTVTKDADPIVHATGGDIANMLITVWPSVEVTS